MNSQLKDITELSKSKNSMYSIIEKMNSLMLSFDSSLKIETETGYYECQKCHYKYVPKYSQVYFAMHSGTTRYMKCPKCNKKSWQRKTLSPDKSYAWKYTIADTSIIKFKEKKKSQSL